MNPSSYLTIFPWEEKPGDLLLFSTKKASKIVLHQETFESIEKGTLSSSDQALLVKLGMIVSSRDEEKKDFLGFFDQINAANPVLHIMVVLNLDCNFACIYCYEGDLKGNLYMSDKTAERLIDFIKEKFTKEKKYLLVDFYGGEPLLSMGLIQAISRDLQAFVANRGASYSFTLVTNGSLFKRQVVEELVPLGLEGVKITIDGPAEIHNKYRPFKLGAGSFDTIIKNIKATCDLVKINIGGNFDQNNYEKFVLLLDYLQETGLTPDKLSIVKFDPIMNRPEGDASRVDYKGGCMSINEPWIPEAEAMLREEILKRGYNTPAMGPTSCMLEVKDEYVVNFDGVLYKCPGFIGKKGFEAGDLQTGVIDYTDSYKLGIWKNEECAQCAYLPLCFGGCRYMALLRDGKIDKLDCKKDYLDTSLEGLIKQDIKFGLRADGR